MTNYDYNYLTRLCDELPDEIFDEVCYELFDEVFDELCCKRCEEVGDKLLYELWKIGLKNFRHLSHSLLKHFTVF